MSERPQESWVQFNHLTQTYDTRDGTKVSAALVDNVQCLADVLYISLIRENQREAIAKEKGDAAIAKAKGDGK
jgi:hypothetical protein